LSDALFVGSPAWDHALFPELDELRRTDEEVRTVSALYQKPSVLTAVAASRSAVLREIAHHEIAHFAGHARVIGENPSTSHLVLAKSAGGFDANVLFASEIAALPLEHVRLVVLSACGDSRGRIASSDGNGLVQAFLDAGAGAVIASQWEADDEATAALTRVLHRELRAGIGPDEALRRAQVAQLDERRRSTLSSSRMWAGFRYTEDGEREK
jgi:CHAT domain-containing protein